MKRNAILTFDYEVFLGQHTGTITNCVLNPTRQILEILKKNNAKAIFFVDATWLLFIKENIPEDFRLVEQQLKEITLAGSSVELHLHPQWINAEIARNEIRFKSFDTYRLHSLSKEELLDLFGKSIHLLESITGQKIRCFRAGGFCIEPFSYIKAPFQKFGIKYDFSVVPGTSLKGGNVFDYDFSEAKYNGIYRFGNDVKLPDPEGSFIEVPLSTFQNNPAYRLIRKYLLNFTNDEISGDGEIISEKTTPFIISLKRRLSFSRTMLSIDNTSNAFFKFLIRSQFTRSELLVLISHPKSISRQSLLNLSYISADWSQSVSTGR
jgi:hypothetical protein